MCAFIMRRASYKYELILSRPYPTIRFNKDKDSNPEYLCKYYSLNERNISAVIAHQVFVSSADLLNDLFDTLFLRIDVYPSQIEIYKALVENAGLPLDRDQFINSHEYRLKLRNTLFAIWNSSVGILSTTDDPLNDLMWAHYTNNEGFLVQFDYNKFPDNFGVPIPVSYLSNEKFQQTDNNNLPEKLFINALLKKKIWRYESEYRFLVFPKQENYFLTTGRFSNENYQELNMENRLQDYPKVSIKKVMLGFNFFKSLIISNTRIDFRKPNGLLRKSLLDWALQEEILVELISIDYKKMILVPRRFNLKKISELEFEFEYAC